MYTAREDPRELISFPPTIVTDKKALQVIYRSIYRAAKSAI